MSYGVALRNGIPFTLGTIAALCVNATGQAWSPSALWPTGTEPGMWIDPSNLTSQWQDSTGTTPVSTPGTVADSSNPVGLALDLRLGATALTDPGNHLLQATSTARPLVSARVNLLTYTEDFGNAIWVIDGVVTKTLNQIDPNGGTAAVRLESAGNPGIYWAYALRYNGGLSTEQSVRSWWIKSNTGDAYSLSIGDTAITTAADTDWHRYTVSENLYSWGTRICLSDGGPVDITVAFPQRERGSVGTPYQPILTDGSTYSSTGFPIYQYFDGTDDGMATASFAAGTLTSAMDCLIAVRRDSGVKTICGLYQVDQTRYFGVVGEEPSRSEPTFGNCGSPTIFVDGVSVANTRGALHSAIGVGDWHILEYRDLDLSAWVSAGFGSYGSPYMLNGAQGGILLFPSSTSAADRDAARTWLGAKVGLTL